MDAVPVIHLPGEGPQLVVGHPMPVLVTARKSRHACTSTARGRPDAEALAAPRRRFDTDQLSTLTVGR